MRSLLGSNRRGEPGADEPRFRRWFRRLRRRFRRPRRRLRRFVRFAAIGFGSGVLLTALVVLPWRWMAPPTTAFMARERIRGEEVQYRWVDWDEISGTLPISAVAAEDQKFPGHHGFDWTAIEAALEQNREGGPIRGGSTISQQVAKNMFLWSNQSWVRKGAETYLTFWIELLWPKRRILEMYLNVAEFGPGVFGVGAASEALLGKSPADLTAYDSAVLVAVLPSPKRMSAANPSDYVRSRAGQIQAAVERLGGPSYLSGL